MADRTHRVSGLELLRPVHLDSPLARAPHRSQPRRRRDPVIDDPDRLPSRDRRHRDTPQTFPTRRRWESDPPPSDGSGLNDAPPLVLNEHPLVAVESFEVVAGDECPLAEPRPDRPDMQRDRRRSCPPRLSVVVVPRPSSASHEQDHGGGMTVHRGITWSMSAAHCAVPAEADSQRYAPPMLGHLSAMAFMFALH